MGLSVGWDCRGGGGGLVVIVNIFVPLLLAPQLSLLSGIASPSSETHDGHLVLPFSAEVPSFPALCWRTFSMLGRFK